MRIEHYIYRPEQNNECLIVSVNCAIRTTQAVIGLIIDNTKNMGEYFEAVSISLIEVDPNRRLSIISSRDTDVSTINFKP